MFRFEKDPPRAFIGQSEIVLDYYSDVLESQVRVPFHLLRGIKINQFPQWLNCRVLFNDANSLAELEWCQLFKESSGKGLHLLFGFGSPEGVWKNDVAISSAFRELTALKEFASYEEEFEVEHDETSINFTKHLNENSDEDLFVVIESALATLAAITDQINAKLFGFSWKDAYQTDEPLFTLEVVIPILRAIGFESVRYNHGVTEYGRDVLFAELDKFSNVRHCAAQVKVGHISASNGTLLNQLLAQIDDAFAMPVVGPGKNKNFHIADLYIICSGKISSGAIERLNQKIDARLTGSVHFLDFDDIDHLAKRHLLLR